MIVVAVLALVVLGAIVAGLLGFGTLAGGREPHAAWALGVVPLAVGAVVVVGLAGALTLGLGGSGSGDDDDHGGTPSPDGPVTPSSSLPASPATSLPASRLGVASASLPLVVIEASDRDRFDPYRTASGLVPGGAVRVQASGFGEFEMGRIEQCVIELGRQTACAEPFPVQFDGDGRAEFQFVVAGDIAPGGCRVGRPTCLLRLTGVESVRAGTVQAILVDRFAPGQISLSPSSRIVDGQSVEVSVTGFPAGQPAAAVLCAPPSAYDARRCSAPELAASFVIGPDGSGRTTLTVAAGPLGTDGAVCGPRRRCAINVVVGGGFVAAAPTPVEFSLGPGVAYAPDRVIPGILAAVVLVAVAFALVRRTDWTKPTEAATPDLDGADLRSDHTLDDLFGTDEALDERDPIPW